MKNSSLPLLLLAILLGVPIGAVADVVFLRHGGKLEGRIVQRSETSVEVDIGAGTMTFPMSSVARIEEGRSALDEFDERAAALDPYDPDGWLALARWAARAGLGTQSTKAYRHVLGLDPNDPEANRALGRESVDGRWLTEEEAYRARGYVSFEGQWMTPGEQESIQRSREADRAKAQTAARRAEAQAREAEAQAREAEAREQQWSYGVPLYWSGWGPGPGVWPTNPPDRRSGPVRTQGRR